jgi:hypothetical protein
VYDENMILSVPSSDAESEDMADTQAEAQKVVSPRDVAFKMKIDYSRGIKDHATKTLEALCSMSSRLEQPNIDIDAFVKDTADMVVRLFGIETVGICIRDATDGRYRYATVVGMDGHALDEFKAIAYTEQQLLEPSTYPSYEISDRTRLFLGEDHPYTASEEHTYRRPGLIGLKRRTLTDCLEADYLDSFFHDQKGHIAGYIEIGGTRLRKLPDPETIRWIELMATILGIAVRMSRDGGQSDKAHR